MPAPKKRKAPAKGFTVEPATPARWPDLEKVFGPSGGFWGCWCMYWRLPRANFEWPERKSNKARFKRRVAAGPPPGLIAYAPDGEAVGWMQIGPRADAPNWNGRRRLSAPLAADDADDPGIWAITCFVVRPGWRGKGVARALVGAGAAWARKNGATALDACPVDAAATKPAASLYHGVASTFAKEGFVEIARRRDDRPLLRLTLRG